MPATKTVAVDPAVHALLEEFRGKGETKGQAIERAVRTAMAAHRAPPHQKAASAHRRAKAEG